MPADTTSLKLPPKLKARIAAPAGKSGRSAHSFILEAVERHAERVQSFVSEAWAADADIERTGQVYRAEGVHAWIERLAKGRKAVPWRRSSRRAEVMR
ncbi:MAG TPA: hypothetical protein VFX89_13040 [Gammaproteobacteria bacterium]|nr:hypothetical protein [Gammaproteobacteria bacterium]